MSENQPLITIGIPTYNRPDGLKMALEKACGQSYKNLEILVSDNASSDEEAYRVVVEEFKHDDRVKYFRQKENLGSLGNFPFLVDKASGEYFLWMSDDDDVELNYVEELYSVMSQNKECAIVLGGYDLEDTMSDPVIRINLTKHHAKLSRPTTYDRLKTYILQPDHLGKSRLNWGMFPLHLIQKAFADCKKHLEPNHTPIWGDYPLDFRLLSYGDIRVIDKVLWHIKLLPTSDGKAQLTGSFDKLANISNRTARSLRATVNDSDLTDVQKKELIAMIDKKARFEKLQLFAYYKVIGRWPRLARNVKQAYYAIFA